MYYTVQLIQQTFYKNLTGRGHEKSRISAASEAFNAWLYSVTTVENPVHGFFPVITIDLGLFFLVAEPENLISDDIVWLRCGG